MQKCASLHVKETRLKALERFQKRSCNINKSLKVLSPSYHGMSSSHLNKFSQMYPTSKPLCAAAPSITLSTLLFLLPKSLSCHVHTSTTCKQSSHQFNVDKITVHKDLQSHSIYLFVFTFSLSISFCSSEIYLASFLALNSSWFLRHLLCSSTTSCCQFKHRQQTWPERCMASHSHRQASQVFPAAHSLQEFHTLVRD